ncbi:slipin family protein [Candidatus Micrarchaeota archaeon]|nr:slipin family protein [Candidatus Micrarchaeota archaeon]
MLDVFCLSAIPIGVVILFLFLITVRIVPEWRRGVMLTLGKYSGDIGPGLQIVIPFVQRLITVDTRITTIDIPKQEVMTRDNVPVYVNAVVYFKVENPKRAILSIENYAYAISQYAHTALRDVIGGIVLDSLLIERESVADEIKQLVDKETEEWGVDIISIKVQDVELPADMKRAMARQAEAEREKRGMIIKSRGEAEAANNLAKAAEKLAEAPGALHLRTLSTLSDISTDASNKIIFAIPIEVLKAIESFGAGKKKK